MLYFENWIILAAYTAILGQFSHFIRSDADRVPPVLEPFWRLFLCVYADGYREFMFFIYEMNLS